MTDVQFAQLIQALNQIKGSLTAIALVLAILCLAIILFRPR